MSFDIAVIKYGGSSLATVDRIRFVAEQIIERKRPGESVVIVASAMGDATDRLLSLAGEISDDPPLRELDKILGTGEHVSTALLSMALRRLGHDAVSLTGAQAGIHTTSDHFNAAVVRVDSRRIHDELSAGRIVVVAGFQGRNDAGEMTTLGRGGSDTTAVVLAGALGAARCEICSDVDGVYSADPRVVEDARRIDEISHTEMVEMARHGASVLDPRAVEHARRTGVEIHARDTGRPDAPGTLIRDVRVDEPRVLGIAGHDALIPLTLDDDPYRDVELAHIVGDVGVEDILVDQTDARTGRRDILIPSERLPDPRCFVADLEKRLDGRVTVGPRCSSVSAIGLGVGRADHVRKVSRRSSQRAGVRPRGNFSGEHSVTCLVHPGEALTLTKAFHREFQCPTGGMT